MSDNFSEYKFIIKISAEFKTPLYYNSGNFECYTNPYLASRHKTIESTTDKVRYLKENFDEDYYTIEVVDFETEYKQYLAKYV